MHLVQLLLQLLLQVTKFERYYLRRLSILRGPHTGILTPACSTAFRRIFALFSVNGQRKFSANSSEIREVKQSY